MYTEEQKAAALAAGMEVEAYVAQQATASAEAPTEATTETPAEAPTEEAPAA